MALTFADTHNMIAYLTKSDASEGFDQILDFLNASAIQYALTEKVIITEDIVCQALRLDDAESIDCLSNEEIFTELARMGTAWNEFSSFMASAVIYLATVGYLSSHTTKYSSPALTQKAAKDVANVVDDDVDDVVAEDAVEPTQPSPTPPQKLPSTSQVAPTPPPSPIAQPSSPPQQQQPSHNAAISMDLFNTLLETCITLTRKVEALEQDKVAQALEIIKLKQRVKKLERKNKLKVSGLRRLEKVLSMPDLGVTTGKLMTKVVTAAATTAASTITAAPSAARTRKWVVIRDPEETATPSTIVHSELKSKDKGKGILVEEPKPLKKQAQIEQDEAYARVLEAELNKNIIWDDVIEQVKRKGKEDNAVLRYQALKRKPQTKAQARKNMMKYFNSSVAFLEKSKEQLEEEESITLKRKTKSSEEKAVKAKAK
uniref:Uncharacterized protein n=1 Tax=Tanacetum cinerariifolium TaxID=118510 RepID=A0A699GSE3_TANCI|nr:hypothetical protein [Tanacetum cinerariifolium]